MTALIYFLIAPIFLLWRGYALALIWKWYAEPFFHVELQVYTVIGFALIYNAAVWSIPRENGETNSLLYTICSAGVGPAVAIAIAWFWKWLAWGMWVP